MGGKTFKRGNRQQISFADEWEGAGGVCVGRVGVWGFGLVVGFRTRRHRLAPIRNNFGPYGFRYPSELRRALSGGIPRLESGDIAAPDIWKLRRLFLTASGNSARAIADPDLAQ